MLARVLEQLVGELAKLTWRIQHEVEQLADGRIVMSFPRAGRVNAAQILAELGDVRERFQTEEQLAAEAGVCRVTHESGKSRGVSFRWACNKRLRTAVCTWADNSRRSSPWANDVYARARARGCDRVRAGQVPGRPVRLRESLEDDDVGTVDEGGEHVNVAAVNLNLFVAFEALLAERNVTRAAKRLGVTQSAVSNALRQLRVLFDDPLFMRRSAGVDPTPRALALVDPVRRGLAALGEALAPPRFDPGTAARTFVVATSDYVELVLLPPLLARLSKEAPGVRVDIVPWGLHEVPDALARGEADLMMGYYARLPPGHRDARLFSEEFVCIARAAQV